MEGHHVTGRVVRRERLLGVGVAAGDEAFGVHGRAVDDAVADKPLADDGVYLARESLWLGAISPARARASGESASQRAAAAPARLSGLHFGDVGTELLEGALHVACQARLDRCFEVRVALAHDLVHGRRLHARRLQLREGLAGVHRVQLFRIADQHQAWEAQGTLATLRRSRACTVEAREPSSTTRAVFL